MNTLDNNQKNFLEGEPKDHVILLDTLEFGMPKSQLEEITELHNRGWGFEEISEEVRRNPYEVIVALLHQVMKGRKMRPMAKLIKGRGLDE